MLDDAVSQVLVVAAASRQLLVRAALPPWGAPSRELWAALEARGQLHQRLSSMAGEARGGQGGRGREWVGLQGGDEGGRGKHV